MASPVVEVWELTMATVRMSPEGQKRLERLLPIPACLGCEHPFEDGEQVRCGQCATCYQAVLRAEHAGKINRKELIREGKMLPPGKGGPRPQNDFTRELSERSESR